MIQPNPLLVTSYWSGWERNSVYKRELFVTSWRFHNRQLQRLWTSRLPVRNNQDIANARIGFWPTSDAHRANRSMWSRDGVPCICWMGLYTNMQQITFNIHAISIGRRPAVFAISHCYVIQWYCCVLFLGLGALKTCYCVIKWVSDEMRHSQRPLATFPEISSIYMWIPKYYG